MTLTNDHIYSAKHDIYAPPQLGLGIDTGGTQTRWALARADEDIIASGTAEGLTALHFDTVEGKNTFQHVFSALAATVGAHGTLCTVRAGITGFGDNTEHLQSTLATIFKIPEHHVCVGNDVEIAYLDTFRPGAGYLIYAGTGSIGVYIDEQGQFHRAGGRGYLLDDGGSGFWIAREALRHIWRLEDESPEQWRTSVLARSIFKFIGSNDWKQSREFIYQRSRGDIGKLALAVASAADKDVVALDILKRAGEELARLGMAMCKRFGERPIALSGRVQELHPVIAESLRAHLPPKISFRQKPCQAHFSAARLAAKQLKLISSST
ncbi:N-acetylglucosamine kinase [Undibacterium sp. RuRC25W]|uniref:N-acetylglucosamine kinase n=1 Tax=Undibacterium sp. RuRC25W TaxID=3413047 RepID=UPI003BF16F23